jgi:hypothetical protein
LGDTVAFSARSALRRKHRTEATEGELEKGSGLGDTVAFSARSALRRKHRTEVTEVTKGNWRGEVGWVTRWLQCEKCALRRKHRTEVTEVTKGNSRGELGDREACVRNQLFLALITISTRRLSCCSSTDLSAGTIRRVLPNPWVWMRLGSMFMFPTTQSFTVSARR